MSVLTDLIYGGSHAVAGLTEGAVNDAIAKHGADKAIAFPDTAYFFPTIYAATGVKVAKLGDLPACVGVLKSLITDQEDLGQALNAGLATAVGAESWMGQMLALAQQNGSAGMPLSDVMQTAVENQSGVYALCSTIFNFPTAFFPCITAAIIPAITACLTKNDEKGATLVQDSSLRLTGLIAMPCTVGLLVLSEPIMALLGHYGDSRVQMAAALLALLAPTVLINGVTTVTTAIMQAHNRPWLPMVNMLIGGVVKVVVNYILVGNPAIGILGAPVGTLACFVVYMLLNIFTMHRIMSKPPRLIPAFWKSALAAIVMGAATFGVYRLLTGLIANTILCCFGALLVAVIVYALLVIALKAITYDDCMLLPKGDKIAKILRIR